MVRVKSKLNCFTLLLLSSLATLLMALPAISSAASQYFYPLNNQVKTGLLVSLSPNPQVITLASVANAKTLIGVVAPPDDLNINQQPGQISVRTQGNAQVLVSTLNGNVTVGDKITPSALVGVGAKLSGKGWTLGIAQGSLNSNTTGATQTTLKDSSGKEHTIYVASIPVLIRVSYLSASQVSVQSNPLVKTAGKIAGKNVSLTAVILSGLVLLLGIFFSGVILYSAIKGGMIAIARQPLTRVLISRKIVQAFGIAVLFLFVGFGAAWLILKIF